MSIPSVTSPSGYTLPAVGFGTYRLRGEAGAQAVADALRAGYRLLDSAASYENEGAVGAAVQRAGVPRDDVIVTSKLRGRYHAFDDAIRTIEESVFRTGSMRSTCISSTGPTPRRAGTSRPGGP